ncbi:SAV_2336 N-terminal domain-related protein [Nostoc punctiforme]|uniref:Metallophosphoesterase n=1 Tax=Nostoc punctiforme (strain ATCC 29133 / PCC 73102) TaxID=63737 RepID=B2JBD0_NOSP7|nr:SAV_2336 N-terminal domain-related protein [Nostoc punctiforme]ACC85234.1 metallophosphoesterase [Nostoc punctiforme PCC 73102]
MIERVIGAFQNLGFDLTDTEIADILWLAVQMRSSQSSSVSETQQQNSASTQKTVSASPQLPLEQNINFSKSINKTEANANVYPQSSQDNNETSSGLPIKVPTAQALRNKLEISRSLKPLKRRVPSRNEFILDEIATAERIAEEKLLLPVMCPARDRWLEVALVIDEGTSMFLWQQTIKEFKQLLERHGAFRDVRTWGLFTDKDSKVWLRPRTGNLSRQKRLHNPRELIDPNGRRLFIIISDCVSPAWYNGAVTKTLAAWANTSPTTIIQVLPEWLWERSTLGLAESILLRSLAPGVPNQQLIMTALDLLNESDVVNKLKIPVVTLEPESLKNWTRMVAGAGEVQTKGFLLALDGEILDVSSESTENSNIELTAKQRLQRFRLTASPMARKLAGLLAAVPISLPIVRLIQQTMLQKSSQVHVAEVLLAGILKPLSLVNDNVDTDKIQFDFIEGIRDLLLDAVPLTESTEVLRRLSEYLAQRAGLSVDEFTAMLVNPALAVDSSSSSIFIRPFAQITAKVLRRLGGKYTELAKELEPSYQELSQDNISIQEIIKTLNDKDTDVRKIAASAIDKLPPELLPEKQQELRTTVEKRTEEEVNAFYHDKEIYMNNADKQIRILHLSDIHLVTTAQAQRYFTQLATDLTQNLNVKQLNYLVISGDIANRSTQEEYDAAFELVDKLVKRYGLDPSRIVIVPGNHDLNWELSETAYTFVPKRKLPNPLPQGKYIDAGSAGALICDESEYKKRFEYFSDRFYKKIYNKPYPQEYDQQAIIHFCPEDKILFLGLNSCWEIDHEYRNRAGIHPNAISSALDQILTGNYDGWLKIAVWHHPVNGAESMKNTAFLEQLAVNDFQVGIHGHIHEAKDENFQYDTRRGIKIIAAGTFGAPAKEQVTGIPLQYNLLTLDPESGVMTVETRKKEKADGAWSADARWSDKNNPVPRYDIKLRYGTFKKEDQLIISNSNVQFSQRTFFAIRHHSFELLTGLISKEDLPHNIRDYKIQHIEFDQSSFYIGGICDPSSAVKQNDKFINGFLKLFKANSEGKIGYYGIVHIPLQFCVGYAFSTWPKVFLFELDRNTNCWYQLASSDSPEIELNVIISRVKNPVAVAIRIAISFDILKSDVDDVLSQPYEDILIQIGKRRIDAISHYSQVNKICQAFRQVLDDLHNRLDKSLVVHIFYTGPVSLGFSLGRRISRTIHHQVIVYNYTAHTQPRYAWGIKINGSNSPESRVVWTTPIISNAQE